MDLFPVSLRDSQLFFLTFVRTGGLLVFAPLLGHRNLPATFKVGVAFFLAVVFYPLLKPFNFVAIRETAPLIVAVIQELAVGLLLGFTALLVFAGIQFAAELISFQMGFTFANVVDPQFSGQISVFTQFQDLLVLFFFLSLNGHHLFLRALGESMQLVPPLGASFGPGLVGQLMASAGRLFAVGVQMAAPVVAAIVLANLVLGVLARTVPQMNILMVGFSLTIPLGFLVIVLSVPLFLRQAELLFVQMGQDLSVVVRSLANAR